MGEMTDDFDAYSSRSPRLQYLDWIKRNHFDKNPNLEVVKCQKFPEFGMVSREDVDRLIECIESCPDCQELGCQYCMYPPKEPKLSMTRARHRRQRRDQLRRELLSPDDLVGKQVIVSMDPGNPTAGFNYMIQAQHDPLVDYTKYDSTYIKSLVFNKDEVLDTITEANMEMDPEFYERQAAEMLAKAEALRNVPQTDVFSSGQVITFSKLLSGLNFQYAALKANDELWYVTGGQHAAQSVDWRTLVNFIGVRNLPSIRILDTEKAVAFPEYKVGVEKALQAAVEKPL